MRISIRFLLLLLPTLATAIWIFLTVYQHLEEKWVTKDLNKQAQTLAYSFQDSFEESLKRGGTAAVKKNLERISSRDSRLLGLALCSVDGQTLGRTGQIPAGLECRNASALATEAPKIVRGVESNYHRAVLPLESSDGTSPGAYLVVVHDPSELEKRGALTQRFTVLAFLLLSLCIALLTLLVHRWSVSRPIDQLSKALRSLGRKNPEAILRHFENTELAPLVKNLDSLLAQLRDRKRPQAAAASPFWTAAKLKAEVHRLFGDSKVAVVANREPYIHNRRGAKIEVQFPASGLVSALEPIVRACSGLWIGHGSGSADRETADRNGVILVPPGPTPEYALKRIWLTPEEEQGYYYGFANEGLWPLCHIAHARPSFRLGDWQQYSAVNEKFARAFADEMKSDSPVALIQDYHFALLPGILRRLRPDAVSSLFWHIPWPNAEAIGICPWKDEVLDGMLGADLIGFHTQDHCNNFLDTVDRYLEARVDRASFSVTRHGHTCFVKPFPIGIEWPARNSYPAAEMPAVRAKLLDELNLPQNVVMGVGVDRLDYTKGITERFLAVERFLELNPDFVGRLVFVQICAPSRTHIKRYQELNFEVREVADRINFRYKRTGYEPILLRIAHHDPAEVYRFYTAADFCFVSSLHDGMNLVAKEYAACRNDNKGALLLSSFTGAAREMRDALIVNPYDTEECARAIQQALTMDPAERELRMSRLREQVANGNVYAWAAQLMAEIRNIASHNRSAAAKSGTPEGSYGPT